MRVRWQKVEAVRNKFKPFVSLMIEGETGEAFAHKFRSRRTHLKNLNLGAPALPEHDFAGDWERDEYEANKLVCGATCALAKDLNFGSIFSRASIWASILDSMGLNFGGGKGSIGQEPYSTFR